MSKVNNVRYDLISLALLIVLVVLSALYFYPYAMEVPHRDSGIYLYIGREVLQGKTIYRQVWEHKPPFIFFINALGLFLGKGSGWGIWGIEVVFLFTTVLLSYFTLRRKIHPVGSLLLTVISFLASFQYMSGNFTEEYALLFQAAIIFIFLSNQFREKELLNYFIIGVLTGVAFNIKQTYIDVTIAIGTLMLIEMFIEKRWANIKLIAVLGIGFLIPNLVVLLVMAQNGVVRDWWQTAYIYNFAYSDIGPMERINALVDIFRINSKYPLFVFAFITWLGAFAFLGFVGLPYLLNFFTSRKGKISLFAAAGFFVLLLVAGQFMGTQPGLGVIESIVLSLAIFSLTLFLIFSFLIKPPKNNHLEPIRLTDWLPETKHNKIDIYDPLLLGIIHYPIVIFLATASGRNYPHYLIPLYSSIFLLFAGSYLALKQMFKKQVKPAIAAILFLSLFLVGIVQPAKRVLRGIGGPYFYNPHRELVQYIVDHSNEDDQVFVWGIDTVINYLSNRSSPSRFSYADPVYDRTPMKAEYTEILLHDLTTNSPKFILDMRDPLYPFINGQPNDVCMENHPADGTGLDQMIHFTCKNYKHYDRINGAEIYERID